MGIWREKMRFIQLSAREKNRIASRSLTAYPGIHRQDRCRGQAELRGEAVAGFTLSDGAGQSAHVHQVAI